MISKRKKNTQVQNQAHLNPTLHMILDVNHMIYWAREHSTTYYLGSFNTNYIIFKNVENFKNWFFSQRNKKKLWKNL